MIRFVESDLLKVGLVQTFRLIWWDLNQPNYDYGDVLLKRASKVKFYLYSEIVKNVCY